VRIVESPVHVSVTVHVDPHDVYLGLNSNDEATLNYICQLIAVAHSSDLREQLLSRLGIERKDGQLARYNERHWQDDDYLPEGTPEAEKAA
jgi:hypothetical protein